MLTSQIRKPGLTHKPVKNASAKSTNTIFELTFFAMAESKVWYIAGLRLTVPQSDLESELLHLHRITLLRYAEFTNDNGVVDAIVFFNEDIREADLLTYLVQLGEADINTHPMTTTSAAYYLSLKILGSGPYYVIGSENYQVPHHVVQDVIDTTDEICPICQNPYLLGALAVVYNCPGKHFFCGCCSERWMASLRADGSVPTECPLCRVDAPSTYAVAQSFSRGSGSRTFPVCIDTEPSAAGDSADPIIID